MLEIVIIGSGNVAQHLIKAFSASAAIKVVQVFARNKEAVSHLVEPKNITSDYKDLKEVPLYLIAVSDKSVAEVASKIPFTGKITAHTSGSVPITDLDAKNTRASFYPVQTFSKNRAVDFKQIPIGLEIEDESQFKILETLAHAISDQVFKIDSGQRKALHVAAVFVCNFVNHLYQLGDEICEENQLPFAVLQPLILETAAKITQLSPQQAQTGPAKRNDTNTIEAHLNFLKDKKKADLYQILTQSIIDHG